jgi:AcrR family transcriptional regulator
MPPRKRSDPRKIPRQKRAVATVDAIVESAARILRERGYEATSVNEVARRAGVSVGSLYQYFPSKEALVGEVGRRHAQRTIDVFCSGFGALAHLPPSEAVRGVVRQLLRAFSIDPALRRALAGEPAVVAAMETPEFDALLAEAIGGYLAFHRAHMRPTNLPLAVRIVMIAVESVGGQLTLDERSPAERAEIESELATLVLRYLT